MQMVRVPGGTSAQQYRAPQMRLGRSQFNLSHTHKTMFDASVLVPYLVLEVLPGDTYVVNLNAFVRIFSPLDAPIMDNIHVEIDYFYVPNRLVWTNWYAFLGAHDGAGAQDTDYTVPVMSNGTTVAAGDIANYMGIPIGLQTTLVPVNALPLRAYGLIWNKWYRDQNLQAELSLTLTDSAGVGLGTSTPLKSAKRPDYFTTALPYLQKGDAQGIALDNAFVKADLGTGGYPVVYSTTALEYRALGEDGAGTSQLLTGSQSEAQALYVTLPDITINALREAAAIQRLLERDARAGTRPTELIRAHFGVEVPDYRVQRPEYLGGGHGYVHVSPVANTSDTANADQGELRGVGAGTLSGGFAKSFVEHGYVIGMLRARGDLTYQQGLERMWSRSTKLDFPWPELAHLGEQPIYNKELFISNSSATDDAVFGYQERYAENRFKKSLVTGKLASDASGSLDYWHLSEDFASLPSLNATFIQDATPMSRITTVTTEPDFIIDGRFDVRRAAPLPVRPVPSLAPARF